MPGNRRVFLQSVALATQAPPIDDLRKVAEAHGVALADDRLRILAPILEQRRTSLQALRDFELADSVAPTHSL